MPGSCVWLGRVCTANVSRSLPATRGGKLVHSCYCGMEGLGKSETCFRPIRCSGTLPDTRIALEAASELESAS